MRVKAFIFLVCLWFIGACKSPQKVVNSNPSTSITKQIFYLETTPCYGTCPAYKVSIFENDSLVYEGFKYVTKEGVLSKKLPQGTVEKLIDKFRTANFFSFQNQYTARVSDFPTTYISFTDQGKTKTIMDYYKAPESLKKLEGYINELVKTEIEVIEK